MEPVPTGSDWQISTQLVPVMSIATAFCSDSHVYALSRLSISECTFDGITPIHALKGAYSKYDLYVDNTEKFNVCEIKVDDGCADACLPGKMAVSARIPAVSPFYSSSDIHVKRILQVRRRLMHLTS